MEHYALLLSIVKTITVLVGGAFLVVAIRAYRKHRTRALLVLIVAIALLTTAAAAEGFAREVMRLDPDLAHLIEAVFTLAAYAVLLYSALVPDRRRFHVSRGETDPEADGRPPDGT